MSRGSNPCGADRKPPDDDGLVFALATAADCSLAMRRRQAEATPSPTLVIFFFGEPDAVLNSHLQLGDDCVVVGGAGISSRDACSRYFTVSCVAEVRIGFSVPGSVLDGGQGGRKRAPLAPRAKRRLCPRTGSAPPGGQDGAEQCQTVAATGASG